MEGGGGREGVQGGRGIKGCHRKYDNREICDITSTLQGTTAVIRTQGRIQDFVKGGHKVIFQTSHV